MGIYGIQQIPMKKWTSLRMVYCLMSSILALAALYQSWAVVLFVVAMLQVGVWTKFCPSMWWFERAGYRNTEL